MPRTRKSVKRLCTSDDKAMKRRTSNDEDRQRPPARSAANARERLRMRVLSKVQFNFNFLMIYSKHFILITIKAFCRLKTCLPWVPTDTKLSKLDTLRLASSYISHLKNILEEKEEPAFDNPLNLVSFKD